MNKISIMHCLKYAVVTELRIDFLDHTHLCVFTAETMTELSCHEGSITSLAISSPFNGGATVSKINAPHNHVEYLNMVILVSNQLNTHPNLGYGQIR